MIYKLIKQSVYQILHRFGYRISRTPSPLTAFALQRELIKVKEPVILDIGAHSGGIAKIYRDMFPCASIHCFEPFPQSFQKLLNNTEEDPRIFCYKTAVSEVKGTAVLNANLSSATNSILATDVRGSSFWGEGLLDTTSQVKVNTTTVDRFSHDEGIPHIDILKMDVQGAEFSVLKGARDMLKNQTISIIYSEIIICPTYKGQHKFHEYLSFLDSFGYEFFDFFNQVRKVRTTWQFLPDS